jgi:hypothetical protein
MNIISRREAITGIVAAGAGVMTLKNNVTAQPTRPRVLSGTAPT